jgi:hypothetical protein
MAFHRKGEARAPPPSRPRSVEDALGRMAGKMAERRREREEALARSRDPSDPAAA